MNSESLRYSCLLQLGGLLSLYTSMELDRHVAYFCSCLQGLPTPYTGLETSRLTVIYFSVVALDMMDRLKDVDRERVLEFTKSMLVTTTRDGEDVCGFIGSSFLGSCPSFEGIHVSNLGSSSDDQGDCNSTFQLCAEFLEGHLAMTYSALAIIYTLGESPDDLPKEAIVRQVGRLQGKDGCFSATESGSERDLRFLYCACAISSFLDDWGGVDTQKATAYVLECLSYDGGLALTPGGSEGQGGATYCGVAALHLMGMLDKVPANKLSRIKLWLSQRVQGTGGYNGRVNKVPDSCYSFWAGAAAHMLGMFGDIKRSGCREFLLYECQNEHYGGFGKHPGNVSDVLHSFYSIAWLSMDANSATDDDGDDNDVNDDDDDGDGQKDDEEVGNGARIRLRAIDPLMGVVPR